MHVELTNDVTVGCGSILMSTRTLDGIRVPGIVG